MSVNFDSETELKLSELTKYRLIDLCRQVGVGLARLKAVQIRIWQNIAVLYKRRQYLSAGLQCHVYGVGDDAVLGADRTGTL